MLFTTVSIIQDFPRIVMWHTPDPSSADLVSLSILGVLAEEDDDFKQQQSIARRKVVARPRNAPLASTQEDPTGNKQPPLQIVWRNVLVFIYLHAAAIYGFYLCFTAAKLATLAWGEFCMCVCVCKINTCESGEIHLYATTTDDVLFFFISCQQRFPCLFTVGSE